LIFAAAFAAGFINAVAGGGTFVTFPMLTGPGDLTEKMANMTNTLGIWPGSLASVAAAKEDFHDLPSKLLMMFLAVGLIGSILGAILLLVTRTSDFSLAVPWLLAFATAVFAIGPKISAWAAHEHSKASPRARFMTGLMLLVVSIYGGYFGAGIGILMLAALSFAGLRDIKQINAVKVLMATVINGVASVIFAFAGVDWRFVGLMAVASIIGGFIGMRFAQRLPQGVFRILVVVVGVALTIAFFIKNY
ncbi:MAG TPA: sulfite exporter TauE/SafE family protein, partial [Phycisphaerae bacterium]|nr:sulfite exporter TauE/SafE family protein [Phycisphaerae bacterium]